MADALLVLSTVSTVAGVAQANKASRAQAQAVDLQRQQAQAEANRKRRQSIRQNLIARAQLQNQAEAAGVSGGSGFYGGLSSATSQFGANLGYSGMQQGLQSRVYQAQSSALRAQGLSSAFTDIGSLGFKAAGSPAVLELFD